MGLRAKFTMCVRKGVAFAFDDVYRRAFALQSGQVAMGFVFLLVVQLPTFGSTRAPNACVQEIKRLRQIGQWRALATH